MPRRQAVVITGIKDIDRRLKSLPIRVQKKVASQSMRIGLKVVAAEVEAQAPVDTGATRDAVQVRAVRRRKRGSIELEARIAGNEELIKHSAAGPVFYPAIVEFKHDDFMKRAYDSKGELARRATIAGLRAGVEREASK